VYVEQVEVPLDTARKLIKLSADKYDTAFSVKQYVSKQNPLKDNNTCTYLVCTDVPYMQYNILYTHTIPCRNTIPCMKYNILYTYNTLYNIIQMLIVILSADDICVHVELG